MAGFPTIAVPGASNFNKKAGEQLDGLKVYLWAEPDKGGQTLKNATREHFKGDLYIITRK